MTVMDWGWLTSTEAPWWVVAILPILTAALTYSFQARAERKRAASADAERVADRFGSAQVETCAEFVANVLGTRLAVMNGAENQVDWGWKLYTSLGRIELLMPLDVADAAQETVDAVVDAEATIEVVNARLTTFRDAARAALPLSPQSTRKR